MKLRISLKCCIEIKRKDLWKQLISEALPYCAVLCCFSTLSWEEKDNAIQYSEDFRINTIFVTKRVSQSKI